MDGEDFREAFLQANARPEFIASEFADVLRDLMRAVSADSVGSPLSQASERMGLIADLLERCPDPISWYALFFDAVERIQDRIPDDPDDRRYIQTAKRGMKYLIETSATDNAAQGRAARRLDEFRTSIRLAEDARNERRQRGAKV